MSKKFKKTGILPVWIFAIAFVVFLLFFDSGHNTVFEHNGNSHIQQADTLPANGVFVHYIDVGQGDSIFVELPDEKCMLIDAGENLCGYDVVEYIQSTGEDYIDYVVATHPHSDHIGGMDEVINSIDIGTFYMPDCSHTTQTFEDVLDALIQNEVDTQIAKAGVTICSNNQLEIKILSPVLSHYQELNDFSAVVKLTYGDVSYLFTGDAQMYAENLITSDISANVLKVGHHGSSSSTSGDFLKRVDPEVAVISLGEDNSYGHPHYEVIKRLKNYGVQILRTDTDGTVVVATDGKDIYY